MYAKLKQEQIAGVDVLVIDATRATPAKDYVELITPRVKDAVFIGGGWTTRKAIETPPATQYSDGSVTIDAETGKPV